ncbi:hypothetical protein GCM10027416_30840 [Okibacterium endophyticum]
MTPKKPPQPGSRKPSRREILKPVELLVMAAIAGVFTGLIALMSTRDLVLSSIFAGVAFIVTLVVIALFVLSIKPGEIEQRDIDEQNSGH